MAERVDLQELECLARAATPGPWAQPIADEPRLLSGPDRSTSLCGMTKDDEAIIWSDADANLIVAMRNSFEALLSEVKELRADFARMAVLGNLARSRTTAEADELSALMTKAKVLSNG